MSHDNMLKLYKTEGKIPVVRMAAQGVDGTTLMVAYLVDQKGDYVSVSTRPNGITCTMFKGTMFYTIEDKGI